MILPRYPKIGEYIFYKHKLDRVTTYSICKVISRNLEDKEFDIKENCRTYDIEKIADSSELIGWDGINVWIGTSDNVESEISKDLKHLLDRYIVEML